MFTEVIALIGSFAKKGCAKTPDMFDFVDDNCKTIGRLLREVTEKMAPPTAQTVPQRDWQKIWQEEAEYAERRAQISENLWKEHRSRSRRRSRPTFS